MENNQDCNDDDARIHPNTVWYRDNDRDGVGSSYDGTVDLVNRVTMTHQPNG